MDTFRIEKQILRLVKCNYNYGKEVDLQSWEHEGDTILVQYRLWEEGRKIRW